MSLCCDERTVSLQRLAHLFSIGYFSYFSSLVILLAALVHPFTSLWIIVFAVCFFCLSG